MHFNRASSPIGLCVFVISLLGCTHQAAAAAAGSGRPQAPSPIQNSVQFISLASQQESLCLMTINLEHKDHPDELKVMAQTMRTTLAKLPDFILCQEVVFGRSGPDNNTAAVLARCLGYYCYGTKRSSDHEGIALISRYPFVFYDHVELAAQTSRLLLGFNRVSIMGEFIVPGAGRVRVTNVHFTNWSFESRIRRKQVHETLQWVADRDAEQPVAVNFLGGDFNAEPDSGEIDTVRQFTLPDGRRFNDFNSLEPSRGRHGHPNKRIDYIFVASSPQQLSFAGERILFKESMLNGSSRFYLSDHVAVQHAYHLAKPLPTALLPGD